MQYKTSLVWFRNDLRLTDQVCLATAIAQSDEIIPVYVFDPKRWAKLDLGFSKTGLFQTQFILESIQELKNQLLGLGSDLVVLQGDPSTEITRFALTMNAQAVYVSSETTSEELKQEKGVERALSKHAISIHSVWQSTLYHLDDLAHSIDQLPDVFTAFRKRNEKQATVRATLPKPRNIQTPSVPATSIPTLVKLGFASNDVSQDLRSAISAKGGEEAAWERLENYFWKGDHLRNYKKTRNGLIGTNYSSKFSLWLAHGCISPRSIYEEVRRYESTVAKNDSTYWLIFELIWRDYFRFVAKKEGDKIFKATGLSDASSGLNRDFECFEKWRLGQTGIPFVDANMRELLHTGFMSNRGRQNVASFLVKDLKIDWRWGASWFESQLIDYDVCSNWGNWLYVAGVGNDPRDNRYFNVFTQGLRYDSEGKYTRIWIPELSEFPQVNDLTFLSPDVQDKIAGLGYPEPLLPMEHWTRD